MRPHFFDGIGIDFSLFNPAFFIKKYLACCCACLIVIAIIAGVIFFNYFI